MVRAAPAPVVVAQAADLILDDLDLVLEHARALRDLVGVRPRNLLPQVVVRAAAVAKDVDICA